MSSLPSSMPRARILGNPFRRVFAALALVALIGAMLIPALTHTAAAQSGPNISTAYLATSPSQILPNATSTVTVYLSNTGAAAAVDITAPVPDTLDLVQVKNGGSIQGSAAVWNDVNVPAGGTASVQYVVRHNPAVTSRTEVQLAAALFALASNGAGQSRVITTTLVLLPAGSPAPGANPLENSIKEASKSTIAYSEELTYRIRLRNNSSSAVTATVTDPISDPRIAVVDGSISSGGSYNATTKVITWNNVLVPANGETVLSFRVTPTVRVIAPSALNNTATIAVNGSSIQRSVTVVMVMLPIDEPPPDVTGSVKYASKQALGPNEEMTYYIELINSGGTNVTVSVTDPIPAPLTFTGTASPAPTSVSGTTLTWGAIDVPAGGTVKLSINVRAPATITELASVTNTATITMGAASVQRSTQTLLVPPGVTPPIPPTPVAVTDVTIGTSDVLTDPNVNVSISATGDPTEMALRVYYLQTSPIIRWVEKSQTGWVPYAPSTSVTLGDRSGTYYVVARVRNAGGQMSRLTHDAIDFASLVLPNSTVPAGGLVPFLVELEAGEQLTATLTTSTGDADLYAWFPGRLSLPDEASTNDGTASDSISFTAPETGIYLILVYGVQASTYSLSINTSVASTMSINTSVASTVAAAPAAKAGLTSNLVIRQAGYDPLSVVLWERMYLPQIGR